MDLGEVCYVLYGFILYFTLLFFFFFCVYDVSVLLFLKTSYERLFGGPLERAAMYGKQMKRHDRSYDWLITY